MVSLWGTKNGEEQQHDADGGRDDSNSRQPSRHSREADERTRLLPPRNDGYLDPDDPAVSLSCKAGSNSY